MSIVLRGLIGRICLTYLDVMVFSKRFGDHINDLREVFIRIRNPNLKLKSSECALYRDEGLYLGHVITPARISPDPSKLRVLASWPFPDTVRDVQSLLGFVNFNGDFIDIATLLTSPLYELTVATKALIV